LKWDNWLINSHIMPLSDEPTFSFPIILFHIHVPQSAVHIIFSSLTQLWGENFWYPFSFW